MERTSQPSWKTPGTSVRKWMRAAPIPTASADAASSAFTFSGPRARGESTGTRPAASAETTAPGAEGSRASDEPELRDLLRLEPRLVAREGDGVRADRCADGRIDRGEALPHDLEPVGGL